MQVDRKTEALKKLVQAVRVYYRGQAMPIPVYDCVVYAEMALADPEGKYHRWEER